MNLLIRLFIMSVVIIVSDIYFYRLLKESFFTNKKKQRTLKTVVILLAVCFIIFEIGIYVFVGFPEADYLKYRQLFLVLDVFILVYLPKSIAAIILLINDIFRWVYKLILKLFGKTNKLYNHSIINKMAIFMFFVTLAYAIYGFAYEKTNFTIQKVDLSFKKLPKSFDGFTIAQISDLHLGSYKDTASFSKAMKLIKTLNPDVLFITGDIINVTYKELFPFLNCLKSIKPPFGIFSILGNHDIGDYFSMKHPDNQEELTQKLIETEKKMGFRLLVDSAGYIKKGQDSIAILGVNNFGKFPFEMHSDLRKALKHTTENDFKILLSHNPEHWKKEVKNNTNIDLTLSGHTHAMQLAIIFDGIHISPSALIYKNWYGLYQCNQQFLYVNPGLGFSGFSGRIGTRPEITYITLHRSN
jgi:uncharacterized protein